MTRPSKSLQTKRDGVSSSASRCTSLGPAWLSFLRWHRSHTMQNISFILAVVVSGLFAGCHPHKQAGSEADYILTNGIPAKFAFITTNTTLQEVVDRVGKYDRVRGSGISYYEYDLPDGSAVLVCPDVSLAAKAHPSIGVTFYRSTNDIHLYP
jgi:hypothetical protein